MKNDASRIGVEGGAWNTADGGAGRAGEVVV